MHWPKMGYLVSDSRWKQNEKLKEILAFKMFWVFFPPEEGNSFLLIDIEEDIFRFIDVFALIYPDRLASDETLINVHCEITYR